jgi:DNA-binding transcriptional regulator YiaG
MRAIRVTPKKLRTIVVRQIRAQRVRIADIAATAGVNQRTIRYWIDGQTSPSALCGARVADVLGIDV